jgi:hypothetical protein
MHRNVDVFLTVCPCKHLVYVAHSCSAGKGSVVNGGVALHPISCCQLVCIHSSEIIQCASIQYVDMLHGWMQSYNDASARLRTQPIVHTLPGGWQSVTLAIPQLAALRLCN